MRKVNSSLAFLLVSVLAALGGAAVGYAFGSGSHDLSTAYVGLPVQYLAATSPPALRGGEEDASVVRPKYVLRTDHGFVAVFNVNDDMGLTLIERTTTPECALAPDERERLYDGISLYSEEQLFRALQDYGS